MTLNNLANLYSATQRFSESEAMYLEALETYRRLAVASPEAYEPDVAMTLGGLSFNQLLIQNFVQAEEYAREGLSIDATQMFIYTNLAASLLLQGKYEEAEQIYIQYRDDLKESFIEDIELFEKMEIIPEEHKKELEKINQMLMGGDDSTESN